MRSVAGQRRRSLRQALHALEDDSITGESVECGYS